MGIRSVLEISVAVLIGAMLGGFFGFVFDFVESAQSLALSTGMTGERLANGAVIGIVAGLAVAVLRIRSRAHRPF
jgi:hypothetical protein